MKNEENNRQINNDLISELLDLFNIDPKTEFNAIPGFESYIISTCGEHLISLKTRTKKEFRFNKRYLIVTLCKDGRRYTKYIARLVYESVNGPIEAGMQIDHLNFQPTDNRIENLEKITQEENNRRAHKHYGKGPDRISLPKGYKGKAWNPNVYGCIELDEKGQEVKHYQTLQDAVKSERATIAALINHLSGRTKTFAGKLWVLTIDGKRVGRGIPTPKGWKASEIKIIDNGPNFTYGDWLNKHSK